TPGRTPPELSRIVPDTCAVSNCAQAGAASVRHARRSRERRAKPERGAVIGGLPHLPGVEARQTESTAVKRVCSGADLYGKRIRPSRNLPKGLALQRTGNGRAVHSIGFPSTIADTRMIRPSTWP